MVNDTVQVGTFLGNIRFIILRFYLYFRDNGRLVARERRYNLFHSKTRIVIEHSFGLLKSRWRILNYINVNSVRKAVKTIVACCVLHNFCYINNDLWNGNEDNGNYNGEDLVDDQPANIPNDNFAENKRLQIFLTV